MLSRLIYCSRKLCEDEELPALLEQARAFNARNDVSGALYHSDDVFLPYLEGREEILSALWTRIQQDRRHTDCCLLDRRLIIMRVFKGWSMTWVVRTAETDTLFRALRVAALQGQRNIGTVAGALFNVLARSADRK